MSPAMHPGPRLLLSLLCLVFVPAFAAKKKAEPADAPPLLISTKGGGPKWKNVTELQQFADKGDPQACFELAERCLEGDGVPRDVAKAASLYEQAGKGGVVNGWFRLGKIHHDGLAGTPDYGWALEYFTKAAQAGVVEAQHNIGAMLVSARGVETRLCRGSGLADPRKKIRRPDRCRGPGAGPAGQAARGNRLRRNARGRAGWRPAPCHGARHPHGQDHPAP